MRSIVPKKSYAKFGGETIPRPFSKKSKLRISGSIAYILIVYQVEGYRKILKLSCRPIDFTSYNTVFKGKRCLELVPLPHFLHDS